MKKRLLILTFSMIILLGLSFFLTSDTYRLPIIENVVNDVYELKNTHIENKILKSRLAAHQQNVATKLLLESENEELKKIIDTTSILKDQRFEPIQSTVISREMAEKRNTLVISKGKKQGIGINMAVLTAEGLVGKVIEVAEDSSVVLLLTGDGTVRNYVSVTLEENKEVLGMLTGYEQQEKELLFTSAEATLDMGSTITTSGLGGIYPAGIEIGKITSKTYISNELEYLYHVAPAVDFDDITNILILSNK